MPYVAVMYDRPICRKCTRPGKSEIVNTAKVPYITLRFPENGQPTMGNAILQRLSRGESVNTTMCSNCNSALVKRDKVRVIQFPEYIVFSLNRSGATFEWVVGGNKSVKKWLVNRTKIGDPGNISFFTMSRECVEYSLVSAVTHTGRYTDGGHYFALIKQGSQWFKVSDNSPIERAQPASLEDAQMFVYKLMDRFAC